MSFSDDTGDVRTGCAPRGYGSSEGPPARSRRLGYVVTRKPHRQANLSSRYLRHTRNINLRRKTLQLYGIGYIVMAYGLAWSPADATNIQAEFMTLLNDAQAGGDAAQLGLALKRLAAHTTTTPSGGSRLHWSVFPAGGQCAAFYAYESNNQPRIFVVGFCLTVDSQTFLATAKARLPNVP